MGYSALIRNCLKLLMWPWCPRAFSVCTSIHTYIFHVHVISHVLNMLAHIHTHVYFYPYTCAHNTYSCTHTHMLVHTPVLTQACSRIHSFASTFILIHAHSPIACSKWVYSHAVYIHVLTHLYVCSHACPVHQCPYPPTTTV